MTRTHEEPEQLQGLGGGDDPALCRRVARHRLNPAAYRAETLDMAKELAEIEEERMRLEKEEYLVRQSDIHFYDFDEMKAVYVSRRFEVLRCLHFVAGTRIMLWVVSFSSLSCFGPRRGRRGVSEGPRRWRLHETSSS